jgi:hypothetical protein
LTNHYFVLIELFPLSVRVNIFRDELPDRRTFTKFAGAESDLLSPEAAIFFNKVFF